MRMLGLLWELIKFDFKVYSRDRASLLWTFIFPLFLLGVSELNIMAHTRADRSTLEIIDLDQGAIAANYIEFAKRYLSETRLVKVIERPPHSADSQSADVVLTVPRGFSRAVDERHSASLVVDSRTRAANLPVVRAILQNVADRFVVSRSDQAVTLSWSQKNDPIGSSGTERGDDIMLGVIVISMFSVAVFSFSVPLVRMRESGIARMRRLMPINERLYFASFGITRVLIMTVYGFLMLLLASQMMHEPLQMNLRTVSETLCVLLLAAAAFIMIGLTLAVYSVNSSSALLLANSAYFFMVSVGGIFFPIEGLPPWAGQIVQSLPIRQVVGMLHAVGSAPGNDLAASPSPRLLMLIILLAFALISVAPRGPFRGNF